jgi:flagellar protein FliS
MAYNEFADVYRQESAHGNHPVELVGKLFDTILEDFRRALNAAGSGDIEARTSCLNHALQVIAELQSVLDHERGGMVAFRLNGFYDVTRALIIEANTHGTPPYIQRLLDLYIPLRQAWKQVERDATTGKLNATVQAESDDNKTGKSVDSSSTTLSEEMHSQWSA